MGRMGYTLRMDRGSKMTSTYVLVAGLAVVLAASSRPKRHRPSALAKNPSQPSRAHVGVEDYRWPRRKRWPTPKALQLAFADLGYDPGDSGDALDLPTVAAVRDFQLDYNLVSDMVKHLGDRVPTDGLICGKTIEALVRASRQPCWTEMVYEAIERAKPEVG